MAGVRNPPKPVVAKVYYVLYPRNFDNTPILGDNWEKTVVWDHLPTQAELDDECDATDLDDVMLLKVESTAALKNTIIIGEFK